MLAVSCKLRQRFAFSVGCEWKRKRRGHVVAKRWEDIDITEGDRFCMIIAVRDIARFAISLRKRWITRQILASERVEKQCGCTAFLLRYVWPPCQPRVVHLFLPYCRTRQSAATGCLLNHGPLITSVGVSTPHGVLELRCIRADQLSECTALRMRATMQETTIRE